MRLNNISNHTRKVYYFPFNLIYSNKNHIFKNYPTNFLCKEKYFVNQHDEMNYACICVLYFKENSQTCGSNMCLFVKLTPIMSRFRKRKSGN